MNRPMEGRKSMKRVPWLGIGIGLLLVSCSPPEGSAAGTAAENALEAAATVTPVAAEVLEKGKQVYRQQRCQVCHSIEGSGNRRNPLDGVGAKLTGEEVRKWIVTPQEMDPKVRKRAYDKLAPEELEALVAYMMSLR